ncbi:unnamed protein product [Didymodactylos carnosus]|uniref:Uncharacterized protein n=1 Tax=Didymodactylos carnosus TaxID=1234261 RepID=A0A814SYD3_9BILA|nr:unnamed protein product [Didymodactylos carnosus]CAF3915632.1 unnamed protein product [Didymodactylos carnosus]
MNENILSMYNLTFDDIEEIFINSTSMFYLLLSFIFSFIISIYILYLLYFHSDLLTPCIVPFIYALLFYDLSQLFSIIIIKTNIYTKYDFTYGLICRFIYYTKSSAEAGSSITIILLFIIRRKQIKYYFSHHHLVSCSIRSRILAFCSLLFTIYIHNWITHLKEDNIYLVRYIENKQYWQPYIHSISKSSNDIDIKSDTRIRFLNDLNLYAQGRVYNYNLTNLTILTQKENDNMIVSTYKDSMKIFIKFPLSLLKHNKYQTTSTTTTIKTITTIELKKRKKLNNNHLLFKSYNNNTHRINYFINGTDYTHISLLSPSPYRVSRCTYYQPYSTLIAILILLHSTFYGILITINFWISNKFTYLNTWNIQTKNLSLSTSSCINNNQIKQKKSLIYLKQKLKTIISSKKLIKPTLQQHSLVKHLLQLKYLLYIHTFFILLRLFYVCMLNITLFFSYTPFSSKYLKFLFQLFFILSCYSIPLRILSLIIYLFYQIYSRQLTIIYYHLTRTKLKCFCRCERLCLKRLIKIELTPFMNNINVCTKDKPVFETLLCEIIEPENSSSQTSKRKHTMTELTTNTISDVEHISIV